MFKKKTIHIVAFFIIISFLVLAVGCSKPAAAPAPEQKPAEKYSFNFITSWAKGTVNYDKAEAYAKTVNELSDGRLDIKIIGGTEAFAPTETIEAVSKGAVDGAYSSASYYEGYVPEASALSVSMMSHEEIDKSGGFALVQEIYQKYNLMFVNLDNMHTYSGFHIWLKEPIKDINDLNGKRLRTAPGVYSDVVKHYGATVVNMPLGDVFTALEQGLIDGYTVPSFIGAKEGFFQYAKYRVDPFWLGGGAGAVFNLDSWNKLPKDLQDLILDPATNAKVNAAYSAVNKPVIDDNFKQFAENGGKVIELSAADKEDFFKVLNQISWEYVKTKTPENADALEKVLKN